jgi:hypothetical protein
LEIENMTLYRIFESILAVKNAYYERNLEESGCSAESIIAVQDLRAGDECM